MKTSLSRRTFLKLSAVAATALPFLRGATPAEATTLKAVGLVSKHPVGKTKLYSSIRPNLFITRTGPKKWVAYDNICTHEGCALSLQSKKAVCACHGAVFNAQNGKPISGPVQAPLRSYAVTIRKSKIYVAI
jgi:Rieske Fe-S protein